MLLISHRGNLNGPDPTYENSPAYIEAALKAGFDVEIDVWYNGVGLWLGHDLPAYPTSPDFLTRPGLWCHAKSIPALERLIDIGAHCFFNYADAVTLTSKNYLWTYPGEVLTPRSICVLPDRRKREALNCAGVCSDFISHYRSRP